MARERAKLTEKQERILVQCQLMGMTTADMVKISNRLKALDLDKQHREDIADAVTDMTWESTGKHKWRIKHRDGMIIECTRHTRYKAQWNEYDRHTWAFTITKPTTRFKPRQLDRTSIYTDPQVRSSVCPDGSKELYSLLKYIQTHKYNWK